MSFIEEVNEIYSKISSIITSIDNVAALEPIQEEMVSLANDKATLDSLFADKATLDSLFADKTALDNLYENLTSLVNINKNIADILDAENQANSAANSATSASESAASVDANNILHKIGSGLSNESFTANELNGSIGRINSPLLDLPLQNNLTMNKGVGSVTFTRSSTATYIDRYGVMKTAAIDEPRFEKDGLLIESESTNLALYSEDSSYWYESTGVDITVDNSVKNPYGVFGAIKVNGRSDPVSHFASKSNPITSSSDTYTVSMYVKKGTRDYVAFNLRLQGGNGINVYTIIDFSSETAIYGAKLEKINNDWYRVSLQITDNNSGNNFLMWRLNVNNDELEDASSDYIYCFGAQIEKSTFVSSYIPTTDSAITRGADICKFDKYNNFAGWLNPFTIHIKADFSKVAIAKEGDNILLTNKTKIHF